MTPRFLQADTSRLLHWYVATRSVESASAHGSPPQNGARARMQRIPWDDPSSLLHHVGPDFDLWLASLPNGAFALSRRDVDFLRGTELPRSFPDWLLARGNPAALARPVVAIVGSRGPSLYGRRMAHTFASALAENGVTVLSGGALGIDGIANRAALAHGHSCAVVGGGLLSPHPRSHAPLFEELARGGRGLLLSQFPERDRAAPWHFPRRNETLALLADFVLVIEASLKSGSLITARHALDRGTDLGALPGEVHNPLSAGTNTLIADGAYCIRDPQEILERLVSLRRMRAERVRLFEAERSPEASDST